MRANELPHTSRVHRRGEVGVVIAAAAGEAALERCLQSVERHSPVDTAVVTVSATAPELDRALEQLAPADVAVLEEPCEVTPGWLERLRDAARSDTNTATASALAVAGGELSVVEGEGAGEALAELAEYVAAHTLQLRPRLTRAVGPCVFVRREALELAGGLDPGLELAEALELDFAQRCLQGGLAHVAADDVVVERLAAAPNSVQGQAAKHELAPSLLARYPYLAHTPLAESSVLARALQAVRSTRGRLSVTLDARALDGAVTGTQVHVLELILALARTGALRLRLLVWGERIDQATLDRLHELPQTEILAAEDVDSATPQSTVFHRPQQAFSAGDVELALALGERLVLSQLDLIAYRNPAYFPDAEAWEDYRRASRHGLAAAERVVVFSDHTRRELLADALVEDGRVRVVAPGLDHRNQAEPRMPAALQDRQETLAAGFLLCLGTDFHHKNRIFALRLAQALRERHGWRGALLLAGTHISHGSSRELERAFLQEHPQLAGAVVELAAVSEQEKAWLLARTQAVVYPSAYEGFGLVPFESALAGVACVFAPSSSLAEAAPAGTATILPWDAAQSADAAHTLLTDERARALQVEALAAAARPLTWAASAASLVEIYREAAAAPVREAATLSRDAVGRERTLRASHQADVELLIAERERVLRDYHDLLEEVGPGRSLVGPRGALPQDLQRALLALSARPALSRPLYGTLGRAFALLRALWRSLRRTAPPSA